jgi:glycerol-3-phosphate cytidylyltransferase
MKRVMVDMSATLIHHGHIRLLKSAKEHGYVVVALTTDDEIKRNKGYEPELDFNARFEILAAVKYVDEVVPSPWLIEESFLDKHGIDLLIHGSDNSNPISSQRILTMPRTEGVSSSVLRGRVLRAVSDVYINKD